MKTKLQGFTLTEVLIVIAILGVLARIAYPMYIGSIVKAKRTDAQSALVSLANAMEQRYTELSTYKGAAASGADTGTPDTTVFASQVPVSGGTKTYDLAICSATTTTYTLRARPITEGGTVCSSQTPTQGTSANTFNDGYLELTNTGVKSCEFSKACPNNSSW